MQRESAMQGARAYIHAAVRAQHAVANQFGLQPGMLAADYIHLACREPTGESAEQLLYSEHQGYLLSGDDVLTDVTTLQKAKTRCSALGSSCAGFTLNADPEHPDAAVTVYFKRRWALRSDDAGATGWTSHRHHFELLGNATVDSHPVHADNCCHRGQHCLPEPACTPWRSYSAVLFLHGHEEKSGIGFEGGEFFFTPSWSMPRHKRVRVTPNAGRMVAFRAGPENLHGVEAVLRGRRCALLVWLTNEVHRAGMASELEQAENILNSATTSTEQNSLVEEL